MIIQSTYEKYTFIGITININITTHIKKCVFILK